MGYPFIIGENDAILCFQVKVKGSSRTLQMWVQ